MLPPCCAPGTRAAFRGAEPKRSALTALDRASARTVVWRGCCAPTRRRTASMTMGDARAAPAGSRTGRAGGRSRWPFGPGSAPLGPVQRATWAARGGPVLQPREHSDPPRRRAPLVSGPVHGARREPESARRAQVTSVRRRVPCRRARPPLDRRAAERARDAVDPRRRTRWNPFSPNPERRFGAGNSHYASGRHFFSQPGVSATDAKTR